MKEWIRAFRNESSHIGGRFARLRWRLGIPTIALAAMTKGPRVRVLQDFWAIGNLAMASFIVTVGVVLDGWAPAMFVFATVLVVQAGLSLWFGRVAWATRWAPSTQAFILVLAGPALVVALFRNLNPHTVDPEFGPLVALMLLAGLAGVSLVNWRRHQR